VFNFDDIGVPAFKLILTFLALGCYGMTVLTALPVQNKCGVRKCYEIPLSAIDEQLEAIFDDIIPDAIIYYIEQDSPYLDDFARSLALIASIIKTEYVRQFLQYSGQVFIAEQEIVHEFFRDKFKFKETGLTPATLSYTSYLLSICANEVVEIAVRPVAEREQTLN
jgi:hypothetical protein